ncbi:MAG: hypothetical protein K6T86_16880, partial [Pirellulales bacterium]|nr:hypothetical protein [Pirellulales bacterium]
MNETLPEREVVLLGVGHTNAYVLKQWRMEPLAGARLTCISDFALATYSGMLPGTLAGLYPPERMQIDLVRDGADHVPRDGGAAGRGGVGGLGGAV